MEYHGKFGHKFGRIQHIALMIWLGICYKDCCIATHTVAPTITGFQCIKRFIKYLDSHSHKPIFYPSNYYYGSNSTRLTWSGNKSEEYRNHNCLEFHQYADHDIIISRRRSVSGIITTLLGVAICWKLQIKPAIAYSTHDQIGRASWVE